MAAKKIAVIVGSLRQDSLNRKMAKALMRLVSSDVVLEIVEIGQLELYNEDLDTNVPINWTQFRLKIKDCVGVLFVTPEYNRSIPGGLKNAIDVGSRPYGQSIWDGKPCAIVSVSPGAMGGFGANHHLRQALVFLNMPTMQQPEAYIGNAKKIFDDHDQIKDELIHQLMQVFMNSFIIWINKNRIHETP